MECYEGVTMIKTFRGLIADGAQDTIVLHTNDGSTGYRIVKFEVIAPNANTNFEQVLKIYKVEQSAVSTTIDFSDNTLLGAVIYVANTGNAYNPAPIIIFDKEIFNQDIYITSKDDAVTGIAVNYYIELEQVKLDLGASTVATLKDIRNTKIS